MRTSTIATYFYLPQDRRHSSLQNAPLPKYGEGTALFADISGFTPLTESLTQKLGPRRGVEELIKKINAVYDALISQVEVNHGSVISFAGDAITCWFPKEEGNFPVGSSNREKALRAALSMQAALEAYPGISLKVAVSSGRVCRFVAGDPQIQLFDTVAGTTITRLAAAEQLAGPGDIITDLATIEGMTNLSGRAEWLNLRSESGEDFVLFSALKTCALEGALPNSPAARPAEEPDPLWENLAAAIPLEKIRNYVSEAVFTREQSGLGEFLTELRPGVAVFVRFMGIDFDEDAAAEEKLDTFIRQVQHIIARYEGTLLQLTTGDKGNYLYVCFGAPVAHEDDALRAVRAALDLREMAGKLEFLEKIQIGISSGTLRVGAYGSQTRRTYGALGDEVNVAARLMSIALPGEILLTSSVQQQLSDRFVLEPRVPVKVKGKTEPVIIFGVPQTQRQRNARRLEPAYQLPMVGRQDELAFISQKLYMARQGKGQVIGITGEAGLGKSRLVAEVIGEAKNQGFSIYGGACESSGTNTAYLTWRSVWQAFFELDPLFSTEQQLSRLETKVANRAPHRLQALPLLGPLVDLPVADNDFTRNLEPKDRHNALRALVEDCLKAAAREIPVLIVLEDVHWIDPLSHELLLGLAQATANEAVCFILAYRPFDLARLQIPRVEALGHFSQLKLNELLPAEAARLILAKVDQLFDPQETGKPGATISEALLEHLINKGQGNPFFLEEILNYLRDRNITPFNESALKELDLPSSLHTLILSRIDQLSESQKATLKVASIIGRLFPFNWLHGYYPDLGKVEAVKTDLAELSRLDITPLDTPEPDLTYLFKHIVTQEVAYETLAFSQRAHLHARLAAFLENHDPQYSLDLLAFHYGKSENLSKQREYFEKAGDAARLAYANEAAVDYYERLLPLLSEPAEQIDIYLKLGAVLDLLMRNEALEKILFKALALATGDNPRQTRIQRMLGGLYVRKGDYLSSLDWLEKARIGAEANGDKEGLGQVLCRTGQVYFQKGDFRRAQLSLEEGMALAQETGDKRTEAASLKALGSVAAYQGNYQAAREYYERSLPLMSELGDKVGLASLYNNLGNIAYSQSEFLTAQERYEASLLLARQIGDKRSIPLTLSNLGLVISNQGNQAAARDLLEESLALRREMGDKWGTAISLFYLGFVLFNMSKLDEARVVLEESLKLSREMDDKTNIVQALFCLGSVTLLQGNYNEAEAFNEESLALAREVNDKRSIAQALHNQGNVNYERGNYKRAQTLYKESLLIRQELGVTDGILENLIGLARGIYREGDKTRFVQLVAAVQANRLLHDLPSDSRDSPRYQTELSEATLALGEKAFNSTLEAGQKLTLQETIELALEGN